MYTPILFWERNGEHSLAPPALSNLWWWKCVYGTYSSNPPIATQQYQDLLILETVADSVRFVYLPYKLHITGNSCLLCQQHQKSETRWWERVGLQSVSVRENSIHNSPVTTGLMVWAHPCAGQSHRTVVQDELGEGVRRNTLWGI